MQIRPARPADIPAIVAIINADTATNPATWRTDPETVEHRTEWLRECQASGYPVLVAEGEDGRVLGFASASLFRPYGAWSGVVENSIYLHEDARGKSLGRPLLAALMSAIKQAGFAHVVGVIDGGNEPSLRLHYSFGFEDAGRMVGVGKTATGAHDAVFLIYDLAKLPEAHAAN